MAWSMSKDDFPASVRSALETAPEYARAEMVDGFFEREVDLGSAGRNSQTDLMVVAGLDDTLGIIAVEGKVEESFANCVEDWNTTPGKQRRLERLCGTLGVGHRQRRSHPISTTSSNCVGDLRSKAVSLSSRSDVGALL